MAGEVAAASPVRDPEILGGVVVELKTMRPATAMGVKEPMGKNAGAVLAGAKSPLSRYP